jgi:hypothetical protein
VIDLLNFDAEILGDSLPIPEYREQMVNPDHFEPLRDRRGRRQTDRPIEAGSWRLRKFGKRKPVMCWACIHGEHKNCLHPCPCGSRFHSQAA